MKKLLQAEVIPIKTIFLEKNCEPPASDYRHARNQHSKNIRNFKFQRLMSKNRLDNNNEVFAETIKQKEQLIQTRPNSSFFERRTEKYEIIPDRKHSQRRHSIRRNDDHNYTQRPRTPQIYQDQNMKTLKNYFPQRKSKKNNDPRWHKYFSVIQSNDKQLKLSQITKNTSYNNSQQEQKVAIIRKRTVYLQKSKKNISNNKGERSKSQKNKVQNEISPWNTVFLEKGNIYGGHDDHSRIVQYDQ